MGRLFWKLDSCLDELKITPNRLSVEAKVRPNTIYNLVYNKATRFHFPTVVQVLDALNQITKEEGIEKTFKIEDILEYNEE
jgi:predicted transcriptional regulator